MVPMLADAERLGRIKRRRRDRHRRKADARVEDRDELRHLGHRDPASDHCANPAADAESEKDEEPPLQSQPAG